MDLVSVLISIENLLAFGIKGKLLQPLDVIPARNALYDLLHITPSQKELQADTAAVNINATVHFALEPILDYCVEQNIISDTLTQRDLMDARIMGLLMPRQSEVAHAFASAISNSAREATAAFYALCRASNYIQVKRLDKNIKWLAQTEFGKLEITINLSKPEKDPKDIAAAKNLPQTAYPKCLLCIENIGFSGHLNHPARQNLRVIPLTLQNKTWYFQYSPYMYYNEHCIILNEQHTPMHITKKTFEHLLDFIDILPHYFIGSNADLPIVGGSILNHDHFQGGVHVFPMDVARSYRHYQHPAFLGCAISLVDWPMPVIRLTCDNREELVNLSAHFLDTWREYSDAEANVLAYSVEDGQQTPHNTITPITRFNQKGQYEMDLVLRNNRTTVEHPLGIFHPHANLHHIKKENIGLIEVMGLAVLPARLALELVGIETFLVTVQDTDAVRHKEHPLTIHYDWIVSLIDRYGCQNNAQQAKEIVRKEVGEIFKQVLVDAGVFKPTDEGHAFFHTFMTAAKCTEA